jgi:hypothetical protein
MDLLQGKFGSLTQGSPSAETNGTFAEPLRDFIVDVVRSLDETNQDVLGAVNGLFKVNRIESTDEEPEVSLNLSKDDVSVQNREGEKVISLEKGGNATFLGRVKAALIETADVTVGGDSVKAFMEVMNESNKDVLKLVSGMLRINTIAFTGVDPEVYLSVDKSAVSVKNTAGKNVALFDKDGNASLSGKLKAQSVETDEVTINGKSLLGLMQLMNDTDASHSENMNLMKLEMQDLNAKVASLSGQYITLQTLAAKVDATGAVLEQLMMSPLFSNASQAATLSNVAALTAGNVIVTDSLNVTGAATFADLRVTGTFTAGNLAINGTEGSINVTGQPLRLQNVSTTGVDILNGRVTIDPNGNVVSQGHITAVGGIKTKAITVDQSDAAAKSVGFIIIPAGKIGVDVTTTALTETSHIFVTPEKPVAAAAEWKNEDTFTITLEKPATADLKVHWWIVN